MLTSLILLLSAPAHADQHRLALGLGAHASVGLRTQLPVLGPDASLGWTWTGPRHGLRVELHDMLGFTEHFVENLPGARVAWQALWSESRVRPYTALGVGGYANDVLPVLPILWLEGGVEVVGERWFFQAGPEAFGLPPFFVGGGLRVAAGVQL